MLGIVYLGLCLLIGKEFAELFVTYGKYGTEVGTNRLWLVLPAAFVSGTLFMSWAVYLVSWTASVCAGSREPLFFGNLLVMGAAALFLAVLHALRRRARGGAGRTSLIHDRRLFHREVLLFGAVFLFLLWIFFFVFHIRDGVMYSGFTVFGDYAPHTAMIRSFSSGNNFPTQYPHFGGADVKYHFMFQFLTGNLEYLGLRMDIAYNLVSAFALTGFLMLLHSLAVRLTGRFACGPLSFMLFFFRSSVTFFRFAAEHLAAGDLAGTLRENTAFIGYTMNEDWGLWNFNVYLNQRHLAFGLLAAGTAVWIYMDWLEAGTSHEEKGFAWTAARFCSKTAWKSRNLSSALCAGLLLGLCAFWNGAAVIGGLLILAGMAVFSDGKLDYAVTAAVAVLLSVLQARMFIRGSGVSFSLYWGFLAEDLSLAGVISYILQLTGIFFAGLCVVAVFLGRRGRCMLLASLVPAVFAFCVSLTPDINVNHKYIMISYAFLTIFWAWALTELWRRKAAAKAAAVLLAVCLTITGVYDFAVILLDNDRGHRVTVRMDSPLTAWIQENLGHEDLMLTPEYSMNEVTVSGAMLYCGWPYYAWSAGYDTNYRAGKAVEIYTSGDAGYVRDLVSREKITYILYEENMEFEQRVCREDIFAQIYPLAYQSEDGRIRIYRTTNLEVED